MTISLLQHDVLPFSGPGGFVATAIEVVDDALDNDAVPVVLAPTEELAAIRAGLGSSAAAFHGFDMTIAGRNPARVLPALQRFVDEHPGQLLVCVGEPVRPGHPEALVREIELHELLLRLPAFHTWNCWLLCAYDTDRLDPELVETVQNTHAPAPADALGAVERARAQPLPPRPNTSQELGVDRTTLSALRGFIQGRASQAGMDAERVDDLVYAVNEAVTNSICHGEGRARVSIWTEDSMVVCEVRDRGWIRDPLAGRVSPQPHRATGRGLWLVNQLCDLVQLRSSAAGTTLRMHVEVEPPAMAER